MAAILRLRPARGEGRAVKETCKVGAGLGVALSVPNCIQFAVFLLRSHWQKLCLIDHSRACFVGSTRTLGGLRGTCGGQDRGAVVASGWKLSTSATLGLSLQGGR